MSISTARKQRAAPRLSETQIAAAQSSASIVAIAEQSGVVVDARKSRPARGDFWAICPFHQERTPSLHIVERGGRAWFRCHGCGEKGDAITFYRRLNGGGFREAVLAIGGEEPHEPDPALVEARAQRKRDAEAQADAQRAAHRAAAVEIFQAAGTHVRGTLGELYIRKARRIRVALHPAELHFHARAPLSPYDPPKGGRCPAIVAPIRNADGGHIGTHVTFIAADGSEKRRFSHLGDDARMVCGDHVGGHIRLGAVRDAAVIGEGWETTLSASEACGLPGMAAINAPNMRALRLPTQVRRVVIAFDRDSKGVGELSAEALAQRLWADGLRVEMLPPPAAFKDWNDAAQAGALPNVEALA